MEHYSALQKQNQNKSSSNTQSTQNKQNTFSVPSELKLTLNLDKKNNPNSMGPPDAELQKVIKDLEEQLAAKINNTESDVKKDLSSDLQFGIKEELKHKLMAEMKEEVKQKITQYIASVVSKKTEDSVKYDNTSIYQDTVPPFYSPGIVLP